MVTTSIIIPTFAEARSLRRSLSAVVSAADHLIGNVGPAEIIVVHTPSGDGSENILREFVEGSEVRVVDFLKRGKFLAMQAGFRASSGSICVFMDGDVLPNRDAFTQLVQPIVSEKADVCLPRIEVTGIATGIVSRRLMEWARLWADAWQYVRVNNPEYNWALSGRLFALQRRLMPSTVEVPLIEDMALGSRLREQSATFQHAPQSVVKFVPPLTVRDWLRQKMRTRRGFVQLAQFEPDVLQLQRELVRAVGKQAGGRGSWARLLILQEHVVRFLAKLRECIPGRREGVWEPIPSTKELD